MEHLCAAADAVLSDQRIGEMLDMDRAGNATHLVSKDGAPHVQSGSPALQDAVTTSASHRKMVDATTQTEPFDDPLGEEEMEDLITDQALEQFRRDGRVQWRQLVFPAWQRLNAAITMETCQALKKRYENRKQRAKPSALDAPIVTNHTEMGIEVRTHT